MMKIRPTLTVAIATLLTGLALASSPAEAVNLTSVPAEPVNLTYQEAAAGVLTETASLYRKLRTGPVQETVTVMSNPATTVQTTYYAPDGKQVYRKDGKVTQICSGMSRNNVIYCYQKESGVWIKFTNPFSGPFNILNGFMAEDATVTERDYVSTDWQPLRTLSITKDIINGATVYTFFSETENLYTVQGVDIYLLTGYEKDVYTFTGSIMRHEKSSARYEILRDPNTNAPSQAVDANGQPVVEEGFPEVTTHLWSAAKPQKITIPKKFILYPRIPPTEEAYPALPGT